MWLRNKYLHEFAGLFLRLNEADCILEGRLYHDPQLKESYNDIVENEFARIRKYYTPFRFYEDPLYCLLDELENDFYKYPDERYAYLKDIISYFVNIMPHIEKYMGKNHFTNHLNQFRIDYATNFKLHPIPYQSTNDLSAAHIWGKSTVELYVISCISVIDKFATFLDAKCLNFNIDLEELQQDLGIFLFRTRNYTSLNIIGYGNKVNSIWNLKPTFEQKHGFAYSAVTQNPAAAVQINTIQTQKAADNPTQPGKSPTPSAPAVKNNGSAKTEKKIEVNIFCESMSFDIPKEHFKVFKEKKNKNGDSFLTEVQFNAFINKAFYGKADIPKQKLNQSKGEKLLLQAVFYDFYHEHCFNYFNTMQCRDNFIHLLTENFEGWDFNKVKANFKPRNAKKK
jgi:hypothetical protein